MSAPPPLCPPSPSPLPPPSATLGDLHRDIISIILTWLDHASLLNFSLCCRRLYAVVFDASRWPKLVLGARCTSDEDAMKLIKKLYSSKPSALKELKLKCAPVTGAFFTELSSFLGTAGTFKILIVKGCKRVQNVALNFPSAIQITIIDCAENLTISTAYCPQLQQIYLPQPFIKHTYNGAPEIRYPALALQPGTMTPLCECRSLRLLVAVASSQATLTYEREYREVFLRRGEWKDIIVQRLATKVAKRINIATDQFRLIHAGSDFDFDRTFGYYTLQPGDTVFVARRN